VRKRSGQVLLVRRAEQVLSAVESQKKDRWRHSDTAMKRMLNHALDRIERHNNNAAAVAKAKNDYLMVF